MFSRLYVLIQESFKKFDVEGIYSENEIHKRKNYLNVTYPVNIYSIKGPFSVNNKFESEIFKPFIKNPLLDKKKPIDILQINQKNIIDKINEKNIIEKINDKNIIDKINEKNIIDKINDKMDIE
jgi:hypothetical protein